MDVEARMPGRLQATFWPAARVPADAHLALWGSGDPTAEARLLGLPTGDPATLPVVLPRSPRARARVDAADVPARVVPVLPATRALAALPPPQEWPAWRRPSDAVLAWSVAAKLSLEWVARGRLLPTLRSAGPGAAVASWRANPPHDGRLADLAAALPPAAHALRLEEDDWSVWAPLDLLLAYADAVADACARAGRTPREAAAAASGQPAPRQAKRLLPRHGPRAWPLRWAAALSGEDPVMRLDADSGVVLDDDLPEQVAAWASPLARRDGHAQARLCVRLVAPAADEPDASWPLEYLLQAADDPSLVVPAADVWAEAGASVDVLGRRVGDPQESLVRGLAEAARLFPPIDRSLSEAAPDRLDLAAEDAAALLADGAGALVGAGIGVLLPAELTAAGRRRLRARLRVGAGTPDPGAGITSAGLDAEGLAAFRWEAAIGGETLTADEFQRIVDAKQPLVRWRGQWVRVDLDEAARLAEVAGREGEMGRAEALAAALGGQADTVEAGVVEVVADGPLADLVERLRAAAAEGEAGAVPDPRLDGVRASLRDYQRRGVAWLQQLADVGLGGVLADDMGLGKTLQTIALLADRTRAGGDRPHLVVCPTSVVGNWERELARFAPHLPVVRHHGPERPDAAEAFAPGAVVVTSYALARLDMDLLASVDWDVVVLDEAQQVKNHVAQTARAVRRLPARVRMALTGTPVENRLSELWSILDFANPGLLGGFSQFKERYAVPIERWRDPEATARLRRLSAPFLLRRVKTEVARDLPDKLEQTVVCALTREQATLYQAAVEAAFADDGLGEGIERRGRILALLTALKQICNHPAQYLGESGARPGRPGARTAGGGRSGKLARATEMLGEVVEAGDRALVFTQYRQMGDLLAGHLGATLGLPEAPFLHGGVPRAQRQRLVDRFQTDPAAPPLLIVSLRAGGTGLNLTRATVVLHYDRWWNPAVEDQATDRAHRIGQGRTVSVHKLVTAGTLEERIADLLEDKRALAEAVVGSGETWLTELGDDELRDLVTLRPDDVADDEAPEAGYPVGDELAGVEVG